MIIPKLNPLTAGFDPAAAFDFYITGLAGPGTADAWVLLPDGSWLQLDIVAAEQADDVEGGAA